jgi:CO/xanthine dehydrogenase FAD-binding subunit
MTVHVATSLADAVEALAAAPESVLLAGGTDLMVEVNAGHRRTESVVALNRVAELRSWLETSADGVPVLRLGSGVTYAQLEVGEPARLAPALAQAGRTVGSPQIRNAATVGGNLATCSPAGDGLPVLAALQATVTLRGARGVRTLPVAEFMVGVKRTAIESGELIEHIDVPIVDGWQGYSKVGVRNAMVIAVASAALVVDRPAREVRVALGSVGPTVLRCPAAEAWVSERLSWDGATHDAALAVEFGERVAAEARPIDDHRSSAAYRRHAIGVMARRQLERAIAALAEGVN